LKFSRANYGVVKKQFVKIAEPEKQQGARMLLLQFVILPQHGS
jgi:hypothetical protein